MRFGLTQVGLGLGLLALAVVEGGWAWALAWPGAAVLAVGLAYLGPGARVFGKRASDGRLRWIHVAALLPYHAVAWSLWQLKSRLSGERPHDEVAPWILVGRRPLGEAEVPAGARVVIDLTSEFPRAPSTRSIPRYLCVPTLDTRPPEDEAFAALLERAAEAEGPIFVHCAMGHGRSATVAAALMIRRGLARDVEEAVARMRASRPSVHLHRAQRAAVDRVARC